MKTKTIIPAAALVAFAHVQAIAQSASPPPPPPANFSDTYLGINYGTKYAEPFLWNPDGSRKDVAQTQLTLTHMSTYKYGSNFVNLDFMMSDSADPGGGIPGNSGAQEAYLFYRTTLDAGKILGRDFSAGILRGWGLSAGIDLNTKNDAYGSKKRAFAIGPTAMMNVPGFLGISVVMVAESNAPNMLPDRYRYKNHLGIEAPFLIYLGSLPLSLEGYALYYDSKGINEFGQPSAPETHINARLMWDVGRGLDYTPNTFKIGIGYEYWRNKFGNQTTPAFQGAGPGATARTPFVRAEYHF